MQRWQALDDIPADFGPSVATLGNFDGVHLGHRAVLSRVVERASELTVPSVAVTFEPHPIAVLVPDKAPPRISSDTQRTDLLAGTGLAALLVMEFTRELASWSPERFVQEVFVDRLRAACVVVGEDTRFGTKNSGDVNTLRVLGKKLGFEVIVLSDLGGEVRWSSSQVRALLGDGEVGQAAAVLGRCHRVSGTVVRGHNRGRQILGYPTANLSPNAEGLVPADGVYSGWLLRPSLAEDHPDRVLPAAISVGTNPTFGDTSRTVEAYALDRDDLDLYHEYVHVDFVERLRPMLKFESVDELRERMDVDVDQCRERLSVAVPAELD